MLYDNLPSFSLRETRVDSGYYNAQCDSGYVGPLRTQDTPNIHHPDQANGLQSITSHKPLQPSLCHKGQRSKLGFYIPFNSQGHIGTGPQNCHLWDSNPQW